VIAGRAGEARKKSKLIPLPVVLHGVKTRVVLYAALVLRPHLRLFVSRGKSRLANRVVPVIAQCTQYTRKRPGYVG